MAIVQGDITREPVDAIVNAANAHLAGGGGVDGAIHRAGGPTLMEECRRFVKGRGPLVRGEAMATAGGRLPARHVIHTAGPVYRDGRSGEADHLRENHLNALRLASELGAHSIAFPAISCGVYGYPFEEAMKVALGAMRAFLDSDAAPEELAIRLVLFDENSARRATAVARQLFGAA
ncbi:MAG: macro domain-containing protein [Candidatus Sumerlaeia bacterium]|nr:macro domain-containing protein [Candidatus Sumerlaeia bacterium]